MGRPIKQGLEYFPLLVHFNDKLEFLIDKFSVTALGIVVRLWQKIYGDKGYYMVWCEDVGLSFARKECGVGYNLVSEIVKEALRRDIFDSGMFDKYSILTSSKIQENYCFVGKRRIDSTIKKEFLLINQTVLEVSVNNNSINVNNNSINVNRKYIKESKEKKRKE